MPLFQLILSASKHGIFMVQAMFAPTLQLGLNPLDFIKSMILTESLNSDSEIPELDLNTYSHSITIKQQINKL